MQPEQASHLSFFKPLGYQRNSCGYCKSDDGSVSYYATSPSAKAEHYEALIQRGWRRSGNLYYKQNLRESCCPHYTLRLDAESFKPRRDQRRAINRWNRYVLGQQYIRQAARLCPKPREEKKRRKCHFDLSESVHETEYTNVKRPVDPSTKKPIEPAHKFEVTTEPDSFTQEKFRVFLRYQTTIHQEPPSRWSHASFKRFLCSGIKHTTRREGSKEKKLGSYHQCYRLDGQLVAVAVLDLLPHTVSSVYLFYDPSFGEWEFGKLSAMREIALTLEENYHFYYMGFYIHSCPKMRYKASFRPQYLLDPESLTWDIFDETLNRKLDSRSYVSLSHDRASGDSDEVKATGESQPEHSSAAGGTDRSLFEVNMPGVLTRQQLEEQVDLDRWLLLVRGIIVHMEDLVSWEESDIMHPHSLKGIVGELAAVLGPEVVERSVVMLF